MLKWITRASENAQRKNIERTLSLLIPAAAEADGRILRTGSPAPSDQAKVVSLQNALLGDLIGPVPVEQLRANYLQPVLENRALTDGVKLAVKHVFDTVARRAVGEHMQLLDYETFKNRIAAGWNPKMKTTIYENLPFDCACGDTHLFGHAEALKELPGMRLVLSCPTLKATATCINIKGFFRPRLQAEFGA